MRSDPGEAERLRHGCHDRDGAIGRHREHAVDADAPRDVHDLGNRREVDDLGDVRDRQAGRLGVAIDRHDAVVPRARAPVRSRAADGALRPRREPLSRWRLRLCRPAAGATGRPAPTARCDSRSPRGTSPRCACRREGRSPARAAARRRSRCTRPSARRREQGHPPAASFRHARAGSWSVPPAGLHRSVHTASGVAPTSVLPVRDA